MDDELDPTEAARARRRDRDMDAEQRDLLRPGMGKVWKQIQDAWTRPPRPRDGGAGRGKRPSRSR